MRVGRQIYGGTNLAEVGWGIKACEWGDKFMAVQTFNTALKKY